MLKQKKFRCTPKRIFGQKYSLQYVIYNIISCRILFDDFDSATKENYCFLTLNFILLYLFYQIKDMLEPYLGDKTIINAQQTLTSYGNTEGY